MKNNMQNLLDEIESEYRFTRARTGKRRLDPQVKAALASTPRAPFVDEVYASFAFDNRPLPIGHGQTISQPYIVALMTDLLALEETDRVLEIGTGSGYQAAVLAQLCKQVYTIETIPALYEAAKQRFEQLGYRNIESRLGNGYDGWPEHAPYDAVIVTAAARRVPPALLEQLKAGGRMVIPLGRPAKTQVLTLLEKNSLGDVTAQRVLDVVFVPFVEE